MNWENKNAFIKENGTCHTFIETHPKPIAEQRRIYCDRIEWTALILSIQGYIVGNTQCYLKNKSLICQP